MSSNPLPPDQCTSMTEVRQAIDGLDREILTLVGRRFRYIEAAARIKEHAGAVRDDARIAQVIDNAGAIGGEAGVPVEVARDLYRTLVEASVAYETERFADKAASA